MSADPIWKDWQYGPVPFGDVLDRIVSILGTVEPDVRQKISDAMEAARLEVSLTTFNKHRPDDVGATIAMTIPTKDKIPLALMPIMLVLGWPQVAPSSITPLAWDRMRAFWEYGKAPVRGELAWQSTEMAKPGL